MELRVALPPAYPVEPVACSLLFKAELLPRHAADSATSALNALAREAAGEVGTRADMCDLC